MEVLESGDCRTHDKATTGVVNISASIGSASGQTMIHHTDKKGFSILETVVVAGLILILLGFAIPGFSRYWEVYRLNSAVQTMLSNLDRGRYRAIAGNREVVVRFQREKRSYPPVRGSGRQWPAGAVGTAGGSLFAAGSDRLQQHGVERPARCRYSPAGRGSHHLQRGSIHLQPRGLLQQVGHHLPAERLRRRRCHFLLNARSRAPAPLWVASRQGSLGIRVRLGWSWWNRAGRTTPPAW